MLESPISLVLEFAIGFAILGDRSWAAVAAEERSFGFHA